MSLVRTAINLGAPMPSSGGLETSRKQEKARREDANLACQHTARQGPDEETGDANLASSQFNFPVGQQLRNGRRSPE